MGKSAEPLSADVSVLTPQAWRDVGRAPPTAAEVTAYVVGAAVWAPSVHNTQPWWFAAEGGGIALYADCGRQLSVADPSGREMMICCGAALFTAKLALRSLGFAAETRVLPRELTRCWSPGCAGGGGQRPPGSNCGCSAR
jgi:hypothetical protein